MNDFLLIQSGMLVQQDKAWPLQLLSVTCLSLAAKMEESKVPLLLDLQVIESRFLFKPKTVQRMELLVMASLKWRLRTITPFDFVHLFISKLLCSASTWGDLSYIVSLVSDVMNFTLVSIFKCLVKGQTFDYVSLSFTILIFMISV